MKGDKVMLKIKNFSEMTVDEKDAYVQVFELSIDMSEHKYLSDADIELYEQIIKERVA